MKRKFLFFQFSVFFLHFLRRFFSRWGLVERRVEWKNRLVPGEFLKIFSEKNSAGVFFLQIIDVFVFMSTANYVELRNWVCRTVIMDQFTLQFLPAFGRIFFSFFRFRFFSSFFFYYFPLLFAKFWFHFSVLNFKKKMSNLKGHA